MIHVIAESAGACDTNHVPPSLHESAPSGSTASSHDRVVRALSDVLDPELGIDVVALGLVHHMSVDASKVAVTLGLTSPVCPLGEVMRKDAAYRLKLEFPEHAITVSLAPELPWSPSRMSRDARRILGMTEGES